MQQIRILSALILLTIITTGCSSPSKPSPTADSTPTSIEATEILTTPTNTPEPLAALINGEGILLADFQAELAQYQQAMAGQPAPDGENSPEKIVINEMIAQILLQQAALENGFTLSDEDLQAKLDALSSQMGGSAKLDEWINANGYSQDRFKRSLRISLAAAWMRDEIIAEVPAVADQVHARQILLLAEGNAQSVLQQIRAGADFATLAEQYDPITKGELGWFPRGYLVQPKVEEAAFTLQPGGVSDVISTDAGYHIILVVERDSQHPLTPDALNTLQHAALNQWIQDRLQASQIEIYIQ